MSATILGRPGALAREAAREALVGFAGQDRLDDYLVVPAVAKVVEKVEPLALRRARPPSA